MTTTNSTTGTSNYYQSLIDTMNGTSSSQKNTSSKASDIASTFLTLLTTQLQNQDPLNPMDNAQITSQLAQINTVSGIETLNATLKTLLQDSQTAQAAGLVGHSVMVPGSGLLLTSTTSSSGTTTSAAVGAFDLASAADNVTVTIKDSNGLVMRTLSLGALDSGVHDFAWDGKTDNGTAAADGNYTISVAAKQGSNTVTATTLALGTVRSVVTSPTGFMLDVGALGAFDISEVKQIL